MKKKIEIINLTPHDVNVFKDNKLVRIYPYSGTVARCESNNTVLAELEGFHVCKQRYGKVVGLPPVSESPYKTVLYIVSKIVAEAAGDRDDLLIPGKQLKDDNGKIIGCEGLAVV